MKHGHYDSFFDSEEEWLEYELEKLREYITDYINEKSLVASDLYPIKEFIQHVMSYSIFYLARIKRLKEVFVSSIMFLYRSKD